MSCVFFLLWAGPASSGAGKPFPFVVAYPRGRRRTGEGCSSAGTGAAEGPFDSVCSKGQASLVVVQVREVPAHGWRRWWAALLRSTIRRV